MNGLLLQPGRDDEGLRSPVSHRVTGWAAISFSSRVASSSRVSPSNTRLLAFRMRLGCVFLTKLIEISPIVESWLQSAHVQRIPLPPKLGDQFSKSSCSGAALSGQKTEYGLSDTATETSGGWPFKLASFWGSVVRDRSKYESFRREAIALALSIRDERYRTFAIKQLEEPSPALRESWRELMRNGSKSTEGPRTP